MRNEKFGIISVFRRDRRPRRSVLTTPHPRFRTPSEIPPSPAGEGLAVIPKPRISLGDADIPEGSPLSNRRKLRRWQGNTVGAIHESTENTSSNGVRRRRSSCPPSPRGRLIPHPPQAVPLPQGEGLVYHTSSFFVGTNLHCFTLLRRAPTPRSLLLPEKVDFA